jgi:hypothetical protein
MSDAAPLIFKKVLGSLRPVGPNAERALAALDDLFGSASPARPET